MDYRPALLLQSGIGRYVTNLVLELPAVDDSMELSLFSVFWEDHEDRIAEARLPDSDRVELASARFPGRILNFLGRFTPLSVESWSSSKFDLFHFTDYVVPPVRTPLSVCTLFDTSYLRDEPWHTDKNKKQLASVADTLAKRARVVITISETSKADIIEHYDVPEERIVVTPLGADDVFLKPYERREQDVPHILMVGTLEPRKNVARTLRAFERLVEKGSEARMTIVGRKGWLCDDVFETMERTLLKDRVTWVGEVSDHALQALLHNATILAYPSLWEGFGLPVLEGMTTGIPVLTSRRGALEEVAGEGAHLVDPESEEEIAAGLEKLIEDVDYRNAVGERGRIRAREFSWRRCAEKTVEAYRLALEVDG